MKLGLHQSARLEQRLIQSPQMIQAMKILQLPTVELLDRIEQELAENPMLERAEGEAEPPAEGEAEPGSEREEVERMLDHLERLERDFGDGNRAPTGDPEAGDRKLQALNNAPDVPHSMAEAIAEELAFVDLDERSRAIAEYVIYSLDPRGYLPGDREELAAAIPVPGDEPASLAELEDVLFLLRELVHPALAAADLREALLLQLVGSPNGSTLLRKIISEHLEDVHHNRLPRIAKATSQPLGAIKDAIEELRHLDPSPGAGYGDSAVAVITPDVVVEEIDGEYVVRLERQRSSELTLSPSYGKILEEASKGEEVEAWLKKRLESARWFIDAVRQRQNTLERIAKVIFVRQRAFLDRGLSGLAPLRMQEVADEVGVHISTVSRAVSGKHAQTPRGIFPLKFFFSGGTTRESGEQASQISVQQRIKELVGQEDKRHPCSDEDLAKRLMERDGIKIARRTVTKYRKMLDIPSSSQRKSY